MNIKIKKIKIQWLTCHILSPDSGGYNERLELKDMLSLATIIIPEFGSFLTLWAMPSFIYL